MKIKPILNCLFCSTKLKLHTGDSSLHNCPNSSTHHFIGDNWYYQSKGQDINSLHIYVGKYQLSLDVDHYYNNDGKTTVSKILNFEQPYQRIRMRLLQLQGLIDIGNYNVQGYNFQYLERLMLTLVNLQ